MPNSHLLLSKEDIFHSFIFIFKYDGYELHAHNEWANNTYYKADKAFEKRTAALSQILHHRAFFLLLAVNMKDNATLPETRTADLALKALSLLLASII